MLLSGTTLAISWYGAGVFGLGRWSILFSALSIIILISLLCLRLDAVAIVIARIMGVLSALAFCPLLLADRYVRFP